MSKLSKRAITLFVIATMILSILSAFIAVPVMAAALTGVTATPTSLVAGAPATYTIAFTTATAGTIATVDMAFLAGFDVSLAAKGTVTGLDTGTIGVDAQVVTYAVDTPVPIGSGIGISIELTGIMNTETPGPYVVMVTTKTIVPAVIDGPTASAAFVIVPDVATTLTVEGIKDPFETGTDSGVTVTALDQYDNIATGYLGTITFTPITAATLPGAYTFVALDDGVKVFDGITPGQIVTLVTIGEFSVTATDGPITGSQTAISVYVGETSEFSIDFVTPGNVDYGDVLTVIGSGVTSGSAVNIYWDFVTAANKLNATTGKPSGEFESTVKVPSAYYGNHYIWVKDLASGISKRSDAIPVVSKIKLSPSSGLVNDDITIKGYGFDVDSVIEFAYNGLSEDIGEDETDDLGYFEYIFEVDTNVPADYIVRATDADINYAEATFTLGAAITLDKEVGPAGTIVKVEGRGFAPGVITNKVDITIDSVPIPVSTKDGEDITVPLSGLFTAYIVIPSVSKGEHEITIMDGVKPVSTTFEVDGETSITVTPGYGTPGTSLQVKGYNFTRISGTEVTLQLGLRIAEATIDASGSFTGTIVIPPCDLGERYDVIANDTRLCHADDKVLVTIIFLQLSELSAPVGSAVTLMGSGFTLDGDWNATLGDLDLIPTESITGSQTYFSKTFHVPSLPTGPYMINVLDVKEEIKVGIDFTITDQAALSVNRASIPNGYNLTLDGVNFAEYIEGEDVFTTTWWIYNSTDAWLIDDNVTQGPELPVSPVPVTDEDGEFESWYVIPDFLELGSYTINCTTVSNPDTDPEITQYAEVDIELVPEEVVLEIGSSSYARGQTITFVIKTTLKKEPFNLGIKDPEGSEYFNSTWLKVDDAWKTLGSWYYIPSNLQIDKNTAWLYTLPTDATPGQWTYSFWDDEKEYANGTFQVTQLTELEQLQVDIGEVMAGMEGIGTSVDDLATTVAGVSGASAEATAAAAAAAAAAANAQAAAEAATAAVEDVGDIATDALDAANNAVSAADAAKDAADAGLQAALDAVNKAQESADAANEAREAADANRQQTSGLTGLVYGAIGASLIAALAAIVSLMQISRRIAG